MAKGEHASTGHVILFFPNIDILRHGASKRYTLESMPIDITTIIRFSLSWTIGIPIDGIWLFVSNYSIRIGGVVENIFGLLWKKYL